MTISDLCWLSLDGPHSFFIEFKPDDYSGLNRKRGSLIKDVVVLLLGTKDFAPPEGGRGIVIGVCPPVRMSVRERTEDNAPHEQLQSLNLEGSLPAELSEVFRDDLDQCRWSSYLVLVESQEDQGKYERLGCFDVWGKDEKKVIETLFLYSIKDEITII